MFYADYIIADVLRYFAALRLPLRCRAMIP